MADTARTGHVEIDRDRVLDDELDVAPADDELPDHLDLPVETPEADAIEQHEGVPLDDEEYR